MSKAQGIKQEIIKLENQVLHMSNMDPEREKLVLLLIQLRKKLDAMGGV
jgi:hypothetical protein